MISKGSIITLFGCWLMGAVLVSCSDIADDERLRVVNVVERDTTDIGPTPDTTAIDYFAPVPRHVLIEDFTGQNCVNCPNATELIAQMQKKYEQGTIVPVAVHSGPLGLKPDKHPEGLATALGDTYYNYWKIEMQPMGVIDRSDGPLQTDWWSAKVNYDLYGEDATADIRTAPVNIFVEAACKDRQATIGVTLAALAPTTGKLQLWLTEDHITAMQKMPDGSTNATYEHNHVLRCAVNGDWGEPVTIPQGEQTTLSHTLAVDPAWNTANLAVVAFVYDDNGVVQAVSQKIVTQE